MGTIERVGTGTTTLTGWQDNQGSTITVDRDLIIRDQGRIFGGTVNGLNRRTRPSPGFVDLGNRIEYSSKGDTRA